MLENAFNLPAIPNRSLNQPDEEVPVGAVLLRTNTELNFTENGAFDPALLVYDKSYQASQEFSPAFQSHMDSVLGMIEVRFPKSARIVEVGAGKGAFVDMLTKAGYADVTGYDTTYDGSNPRIHARYLASADALDADLVVMRHTMEHLHRPHLFVEMLAGVFRTSPNAQIYIEVPCFEWTKKHEAFFDITFEHVNYFTKRSLSALFDDPNSEVGHIFNGQYLFIFAKLASRAASFGRHYDKGPWKTESFAELFPSQIRMMREIDARLDDASKVYLWGAGTKGCLFLLHAKRANLITHALPFAVDINPHKIGKWLPVSGIPVKAPNDLFKVMTERDTILISNPNYADEIRDQLRLNGFAGASTIVL